MLPASIPSPDPVWSQIHLGPLTIHTYALCLLAGIAAAAYITDRRLRARGAAPGLALDIAMWAVPIGIVGARIYHVLTHLGDFTGPGVDPWAWIRIWEGGNALFGSLLGGAVGVWIGCRLTGLRFWSFADALAPGLLAAQAIGRLGNYVNQELFGLPTTLPWGLEIRPDAPMFPDWADPGTLFHPLFLYEMIWNVIGIALLLTIERRVVRRNEALLADGGTPGAGLRWGRMFGLYLIWYGLGRSWLEAIRIDPTSDAPLGVPANIWTSGVAVLLGIVIVVVQGRRHPEPEPSVYQPGREPEDEDAEAVSEEAAEADAKDAKDVKDVKDDEAEADTADDAKDTDDAAGRVSAVPSKSTASKSTASESAVSKTSAPKSTTSEAPAEGTDATGSSDSR
ncbi:prolipoprotein diacylglyceryl transferase [Promicromonospora iranensis]|uniref:prolipoprotein diacylglyceryl transferase n=1 Tax=Promicromonospora iranensis TaxID=1105144 RepID=UPI0023A9FCFD|nr:prolipoprotein diacylglyceryl transferase [Promicromonospora iranensis]